MQKAVVSGGGMIGITAAVTLARIAFGYQVQTVASLGPDLVAAFHMDFVVLGTLIGIYMLPGIIVAIPSGLLARRFGDCGVVALGLGMMMIGSLVSAAAHGPGMIGAGRLIAGAGAVTLTVLQGKIIADRFTGRQFTMIMGVLVSAYPIGIGMAQLTQEPLAHAFGWPAAFVAGAVMALVSLVLFLATWDGVPHVAAARIFAWPSRHEAALVVVSGLIWTAFNAAYANFLGYMPSYLAAHGHPVWVANVVLSLATWVTLPATLLGGAMAARFGQGRVFVFGTLMMMLAVGGVAVADWPLVWGALFGTLATMHAGIIVELGTLSARPQNRAVGMGLFYTTYYLGGSVIPALCGHAADFAGDPSGAFLAAAVLSSLALPFYWLHRRLMDREINFA